MRRLFPLLLAFCIVITAFSGCDLFSEGFDTNGMDGFTLNADPAMMRPVTASASDTALLGEILGGAARPDTIPAAPQQVAMITASSPGGEKSYTILREKDIYYAREGELLLQIDGEAFLSLLSAFGDEYYLYADLPEAEITVAGSAPKKMPWSLFGYYYIAADGSRQALPNPISSAEPPVYELVPGDEIGVSISRPLGHAEAEIRLRDGEVLWNGGITELSTFTPETTGEYELYIKADFSGASNYYGGKTEWTARLRYTVPLSFSVHGDESYPGELVVLRAHNVPEGESIEFISDIPFKPSFFDDGSGGKIGLLAMGTGTLVGEHSFILQCAGYSEKFMIKTQNKQFEIQNLIVSNEVTSQTIDNAQANYEFELAIAPLRPVADERQHWSQPFMWPLEQRRVTTQFGMIRYVNGAPTSTRHHAFDFAAATGTPVMACNSGRVLIAGYFQLTGNTVLIEHGYGLKSWHYHMDSLDVKTGDMVEIGQVIGKVGSTGFSTGPHLHFGMSVRGTFINPQTIIESQLLTRSDEE